MRRYNSKALRIEFAAPHIKIVIVAVTMLMLSFVCFRVPRLNDFLNHLFSCSFIFLAAAITSFLIATVSKVRCSEEKQIRHKIIVGLYYHGYGNPLHLRDGEYCPKVKVEKSDINQFLLTIFCTSISVETLNKLSSVISSLLNQKQQKYAVTIVNTDVAYNFVQYIIEDVTIDRSYTFRSVEEMVPASTTKFKIQQGDGIDLTTSGSMLFAGKTRSGKTTGVISVILQALLCGQDDYNSSITIIDPKRAELSMLPYTVTVTDDGEATAILQALKAFESVVKERQQALNVYCKKVGDAIHWWEIGMHPSFLFIDEYVACRSLFPKKAEKGSDYCLQTFDNILRRIVTMGASAGCFAIISIAEASVEEGGLPSMLRNAMTTKILFKPTIIEGRLLWDSSKLENFSERVYNAGDCWFSSTDGVHDNVTYAHFPHLRFPVYKELGRLLKNYYGESADGGSPQDGAR